MQASLILWPVLAQVFLTLLMFFLLGARKSQAVKAGLVDRQKAALNNRAWPDNVVQVSNNINNQFELPILFYVIALLLFSVDAVGIVALVLSWLFVISRYIHAYIHTHSNYVPMRMRVYIIGSVTVIALFVQAVIALL